MSNFTTHLPVREINPTGIVSAPLETALAMGAGAMFQSPVQVSQIPAGGSFLLEIPLNVQN
jgi:hypothetical protein